MLLTSNPQDKRRGWYIAIEGDGLKSSLECRIECQKVVDKTDSVVRERREVTERSLKGRKVRNLEQINQFCLDVLTV